MLCIPNLRATVLSCVVFAMPFFAGCGGGGDDPSPINAAQCSGGNCPASGSNTTPSQNVTLCPASLDYTSTYSGGAGSGEYLKVRFDTTRKTYQMQFIESSVPTLPDEINTTRAGLTINGTFHNATTLPTAEQNRCAFVLDNGATADGTYKVTINPADPPIIFVGNGGVMGGAIPGATISYPGILALGGLGKVPSRTFDFYPFIGFTSTETDFTKVAGNYNELGVHMSPVGGNYQSGSSPIGWEPDVVNWNQTFNADGSCTITPGSDYSCQTTGSPWTLRKNADGSSDNVFVSNAVANQFGTVSYPVAGQAPGLVIVTPSQAKGIMIVGKLNGVLVPVVIRVGYAYIDPTSLLASVADAEVGISVLAPPTPIVANSLQGGFIGATSASACGVVSFTGNLGTAAQAGPSFNPNIAHPDLPGVFSGGAFASQAGSCNDGTAVQTMATNYTSTLFQGATAGLIDPQTSRVTSQLSLDYSQASPGKIKVNVLSDFRAQGSTGAVSIFKKGDTGYLIKVGNVYGMVVNNSQVNPFFTVGAFVR